LSSVLEWRLDRKGAGLVQGRERPLPPCGGAGSIDQAPASHRVQPRKNRRILVLERTEPGGGVGEHGLREILGDLVALGPPAEESVDLPVVAAERGGDGRFHYFLLAQEPRR
jgi:hypothetical protein